MVTALDEKASASFRQHLPDLSSPRLTTAKEQDAYSYADAFSAEQNPPWLYNLTRAWQRLYEEPYKGVWPIVRTYHGLSFSRLRRALTGNVIPNLFPIQDEGIPINHIVNTVKNVFDQINSEQKAKLLYLINARE